MAPAPVQSLIRRPTSRSVTWRFSKRHVQSGSREGYSGGNGDSAGPITTSRLQGWCQGPAERLPGRVARNGAIRSKAKAAAALLLGAEVDKLQRGQLVRREAISVRVSCSTLILGSPSLKYSIGLDLLAACIRQVVARMLGCPLRTAVSMPQQIRVSADGPSPTDSCSQQQACWR